MKTYRLLMIHLLLLLGLLIPLSALGQGMVVDGTGSELKGGPLKYRDTGKINDSTNDSATAEESQSSSDTTKSITTSPGATLPPASGGKINLFDGRSSDAAESDHSTGEDGGLSEEQGESPDSEVDPGEPWKYDPTALTVTYQGKNGVMVTPGIHQATILIPVDHPEKGQVMEQVTVPAREVTFETKAPADRVLAVVDNTKSGYVKLHKASSVKSVVIEKPRAGQVLPVLAVGKNFTKVHYQGAVGYVRTSFLTFSAPAAADTPQAQVAYRGNVRSRTTVKVRAKDSGGSRVVGEFPCGTVAAVMQPGEKWTQVEIEGTQCYILTEFLTVPDQSAIAATAATEPPGSTDAPAPAETGAPAETPAP